MHKRGKKMIKKQLLYSLVFSYIAVVFVGIGLYTTLNLIATKSIEEEITKSYTAMLENMAINMDYTIEDVRNMAIDIKEKVGIREVLFLNEQISSKENYRFVRAVNDLAGIRSFNSFIRDTYVYYTNQEIIVGKSGIYYPQVAYRSFHENQLENYDKWIELLEGKYYKGYITTINDQLIFIQTISIQGRENYANIVIMFNEDRLNTFMEECNFAEYGQIAMLDEEGKVLLSNVEGGLEELTLSLEKMYQDKKGYKVINKGSMQEGIKYIGVISNEVFGEKISYINRTFIIFTVCFVMILLLGIYIIYKKYGHIKQLLDKIKGVAGIEKEQAYGELEYIENVVTGMHKKLEEDKSIIVENIFRKAIYGTQQNQCDIEQYLGKKFTMSQFIIASLNTENQETKRYEEEIYDFIIKNVFEEMLGDTYDLNIIKSSNGYLLIINFQNLSNEYMYEETLHRLSVGREFLENKFKIRYILSVSNLHTEVSSLKIAYDEVQKILQYNMLFNESKVVTYTEILNEDNPYYYNIEDSINLTKYIQEGSEKKAIEILEKLFKQNFKEESVSLDRAKKLINEICIILERITYEMRLEKIESLDLLAETKSIEEIESEMKSIIYYLCECVNKNKTQELDNKIKLIIRYIEENYYKEDLTVTSIAEKFDMKVSYVSRFFKENVGENLLQYITKYRIEKAKHLLINTNLNLNEIAEQIGLLNNVALIRCFKKYEYITPNEYRNANKP